MMPSALLQYGLFISSAASAVGTAAAYKLAMDCKLLVGKSQGQLLQPVLRLVDEATTNFHLKADATLAALRNAIAEQVAAQLEPLQRRMSEVMAHERSLDDEMQQLRTLSDTLATAQADWIRTHPPPLTFARAASRSLSPPIASLTFPALPVQPTTTRNVKGGERANAIRTGRPTGT